MFAVFGLGAQELVIIGLVCCVLVVPLLIGAVVLAVLVSRKRD